MPFSRWLVTGCFLALVAPLTAGFYAPGIDGVPQAGEAFNLTVANTTNYTDPKIRYRGTDDPTWRTCPLENGTCTFTDGLDQDVYRYYVINGSDTASRFPRDGTLTLAVSTGNQTWRDIARNFTDTDPTNDGLDDSCYPWQDDYSCAFEDMQGAMIHGFGRAHLMTGNDTYRSKMERLALDEYDDTGDGGDEAFATCDINNSDYDCKNRSSNTPESIDAPTSAARQSALMHGLSWSGRMLGNDSVRDAGRRYMNGSAENCDIWQEDYDCQAADDQGRMVQGAWAAYIATGNDTFERKAAELSAVAADYAADTLNASNVSHEPELVRGLWRAYAVTGNTTYRNSAADLLRATGWRCANRSGISACGIRTQLATADAALAGYEQTGKHRYRQLAFATLTTGFNGSCNPWNGTYACDRAHRQGDAAAVYWRAYQTLPVEAPGFHAPRIMGTRTSGDAMPVSVRMQGDVRDPAMLYRKQGAANWSTCPIHHWNRTCTLPGDALMEQTTYEYRFNASNTQFPANGSFAVMVAHQNDTTRRYAENLTEASDRCDSWGSEYSCLFAHWQQWNVRGFGDAYRFSANDTYRDHAEQFSVAPIDDRDEESDATCDHADNDFNCTGTNPNGSVRQGGMIASLWEQYSETGNATVRALAANYTRGQPDDCPVWDGDFACDADRGQGRMIAGFLSAYAATGNMTYLDVARNLSDAAYASGTADHPAVLGALWDAAGITGNQSYAAFADEQGGVIGDCADGSCGAVRYADSALAALTGYRRTGNDSYYETAYDVFHAGVNDSVDCAPWDGDFACTDADEQGSLISTFWTLYGADRITVDGDVALDASADTVQTGDTLTATCTVTNTVANGTDLLAVTATLTADGFTVDGNTTVELGDIPAETSTNHTWDLTAEAAGDHTLQCDAAAENDWRGSATAAVTVESDEDTDDGDTDDTTGALAPAPTEPTDNTTTTQFVAYDFGHQTPADALSTAISDSTLTRDRVRALLAVNDTMRVYRFTANRTGCLSGWRNASTTGNVTTSWLQVRQTCDVPVAGMVVYDAMVDAATAVEPLDGADRVDRGPAAAYVAGNGSAETMVVTARYRMNGSVNLSTAAAPFALLAPVPAPPENTSVTVTVADRSTGNGTVTLAVAASGDTGDCTVRRNGARNGTVTPGATADRGLQPGWNNFTVSCPTEDGTVADGVAVRHEPDAAPDVTEQLAVVARYGGLIGGAVAFIGLLAGIVYVRRRVYRRVRQYWLQWKLRRMRKQLAAGDATAAIKTYNDVKTLYGTDNEVPGMAFWRERLPRLGDALQLYLLLDITEQKLARGETGAVRESLPSIRRIYDRFTDADAGEETRELIESKRRAVQDRLAAVDGVPASALDGDAGDGT